MCTRFHLLVTLLGDRIICRPGFSICSAWTNYLTSDNFFQPIRVLLHFVLPIASHLQYVQRSRVSSTLVPAFSLRFYRDLGVCVHMALPMLADLQTAGS